MKYLVTGAAGFIGSTLVDTLLRQGHEVRGIDCFIPYYPEVLKRRNIEDALLHECYEFHEESLLTTDLNALLDGIDCVFHQAGQAGVRASWGEYFQTYTDNNIQASQRLLDTIRTSATHVQKFVYASSSSVYGNAEQFPTSEDRLPAPVSPYGVTKLAAEHLMHLYAAEFGVHTTSLRYFTVYGPRQRPEMAFMRFINKARAGVPIHIFGDGEQSRDFTYVDDIVAANILAAEKGKAGAVYNIGGGRVATVNEVLDTIEASLGSFERVYEDRQKGDARHTASDTTRARADLGYDPQVSLEMGIQQQIAWVQDQGADYDQLVMGL